MIEDAGFGVNPDVDTLAETLDRALNGERPPQEPSDRATQYDWNNVASQAESVYQRAVVGQWESRLQTDRDRRSLPRQFGRRPYVGPLRGRPLNARLSDGRWQRPIAGGAIEAGFQNRAQHWRVAPA